MKVAKTRKQYRMNWLQILRKLEAAYKLALKDHATHILEPLSQAIDAYRERIGFPVDLWREELAIYVKRECRLPCSVPNMMGDE